MTAAGFYEGSVTVEVRGEEGAELRYTTDGETPTQKSKLFPAEGLTLKKTTPLRVKAFREGTVSSSVAGGTFFIDDAPQTAIVSLIRHAGEGNGQHPELFKRIRVSCPY